MLSPNYASKLLAIPIENEAGIGATVMTSVNTVPRLKIFVYLGNNDGGYLSVHEIAKANSISAPTTCKILKHLVEVGTAETDGRGNYKISELGTSVYAVTMEIENEVKRIFVPKRIAELQTQILKLEKWEKES